MEDKVPKFDERFFLLTILNDYKFEHGFEIRFFSNHIFDLSAEGRLAKSFPDLVQKKHIQYTKKRTVVHCRPHSGKWFDEAHCRGFVQKNDKGEYLFTEKGFYKALEYDQPFKTFWKKNYQFIITTIIASIAAIFAILNYFR